MTSFETDIRPLFRETDRVEMDFVFDLWDYDDVRAGARSILSRVEDGTMPCDGAWPHDRIDLFRSWLDEGCPP